jgi:putative transcriptional regulator
MSAEIKMHPDDATLVSYAAGTLHEGLAAVVAAHVSMCSRCRKEMDDLELIGASLLLASPSSGQALEVPRRPVGAVPKVDRAPLVQDPLPEPIVRAYGISFDAIPWKWLGPGVQHHPLQLGPGEPGDLRLLRIGPGRRMPDHGHGGAELTLVISGAYSDATGNYRRGDIQDVDEGIEHQPIVDKDEACICLIASERPARFKGLVGRLVQPWTRM